MFVEFLHRGLALSRFWESVSYPRQVLLFPVNVDEAVPADCEVRVFSEAMDGLDWSVLESLGDRLISALYEMLGPDLIATVKGASLDLMLTSG